MPFTYIPECISHAKWYISIIIIIFFKDLGLCLILLEVKRGTLIIHLFFPIKVLNISFEKETAHRHDICEAYVRNM